MDNKVTEGMVGGLGGSMAIEREWERRPYTFSATFVEGLLVEGKVHFLTVVALGLYGPQGVVTGWGRGVNYCYL